MDAVIQLKGAGFRYASAEAGAVGGIDLVVHAGEVVVVTGPSGCGKTTLARMVNGLVPAMYAGVAEGSVLVAGVLMEEWELDGLARVVGSVFQNPRTQFFNLDTTSEIAFGCENAGLPCDEIRARVDGAARMLSIEGLLDRDIRALSGGQKQLVATASACAMRPMAYVLDEPTAALDVDAMLRLRDAVARLKRSGAAVLIAEHRLWWLRGVADRVVLMQGGRIVSDMEAGEFGGLSAADRQRLGVRAWDVADVALPVRTRPEAGAVALAAHGVAAGYDRRTPCVAHADFQARAGRVVALIGRNGAGKTTLSRVFAGLHREMAGQVEVCGVPLSARERAGRVYLGMQESGYQLFSDTVAGELESAVRARGAAEGMAPARGAAAGATSARGAAEGGLDGSRRVGAASGPGGLQSEAERGPGRPQPEAECGPGGPQPDVERKVAAALDDFGLVDVRERHPLSLSGGQRQRVAIAAGILQGARVMVLDEPTSGLDLANMQRVAAQIRACAARGACIVVVTHDFEFACSTCDEIAFMTHGHIGECFDLAPGTLRRARELFGFPVSGG